MSFAYEKLNGLDRERLLGVVEPVLRAHHVRGVEVIWRTDHRGRVLYLTVEDPHSSEPGAGITLDLCAELSRDLSAALDVTDLVLGAYRLEVGSPGVERKLYRREDYGRFSGQHVKIRCREPVLGQVVQRGLLAGSDEAGKILVDTEHGVIALGFDEIQSGQLVLDLTASSPATRKPRGSARGSRRKSVPRS
jgi:ribosome maturation factor RimP